MKRYIAYYDLISNSNHSPWDYGIVPLMDLRAYNSPTVRAQDQMYSTFSEDDLQPIINIVPNDIKETFMALCYDESMALQEFPDCDAGLYLYLLAVDDCKRIEHAGTLWQEYDEVNEEVKRWQQRQRKLRKIIEGFRKDFFYRK